MSMKFDYMKWRILLRAGIPRSRAVLPAGILTMAPPLRHESMPTEVSLLLPTNKGPTHLINQVTSEPGQCENKILGLFLANPFFNVKREGARLAQAGVRWIANLPSVEQQDREFSQQLADVALDQGRELNYLAQFRGQGFRIAAVVADKPGASAAAAISPEAIIVMPRVADFAAGFPSLLQRGTAAQAVADAVCDADWSGILLGLGDAREAESEELWPRQWDGLIYRQTSPV